MVYSDCQDIFSHDTHAQNLPAMFSMPGSYWKMCCINMREITRKKTKYNMGNRELVKRQVKNVLVMMLKRVVQ